MDLELKLWDDTRSQIIQFYLAKLFRRGNQSKTKLLYHFRIGLTDEDKSLHPLLEVLSRESELSDWERFSLSLRDLILSRTSSLCFNPREKDIKIDIKRIITTPQVDINISIDGTAYLFKTPEITGHMDICFNFVTTIELLKQFQSKLHQILQMKDFRTQIEQLPQPEIHNMYDVQDEADQTDEYEVEEEDAVVVEDPVEEKTEDKEYLVKQVAPSTEMLSKIEDDLNGKNAKNLADGVEVEDWEENQVDEIGGDKGVETLENIEKDYPKDEVKPVKKSESVKTEKTAEKAAEEEKDEKTVIDAEKSTIIGEKIEKPAVEVEKTIETEKSKTLEKTDDKVKSAKELFPEKSKTSKVKEDESPEKITSEKEKETVPAEKPKRGRKPRAKKVSETAEKDEAVAKKEIKPRKTPAKKTLRKSAAKKPAKKSIEPEDK